MTLREIAEDLKERQLENISYDTDEVIRFLLNYVVEERARFNYVTAIIAKKELPDPDKYWHKNEDLITDVKECWTHLKEEYKNDYRTKALDELNLKGVWPGKEG